MISAENPLKAEMFDVEGKGVLIQGFLEQKLHRCDLYSKIR